MKNTLRLGVLNRLPGRFLKIYLSTKDPKVTTRETYPISGNRRREVIHEFYINDRCVHMSTDYINQEL